MIGAGVASVFAGLIRDFQGTYLIAWVTAAILCLVATALVWTLRKDPEALASAG